MMVDKESYTKQPLADVFKIAVLKIFEIHRKTPVLESLCNKVAGLRTPTKMFSCEYCKIFKKNFLYREHLRWLLLIAAINRRYFDITASKFQKTTCYTMQ